jgi:amino acid transporter
LAVYWAVTLLNFKFDMAKIGGKVGVWLGLYIPVAALFILGLAALAKTGLDPKSVLGSFDSDKLVLDSETISSLKYLLPIMFVFTGIEMSSVYITRLENPTKNYFRGIIAALVFMALFNVVNGFLLADAVEGNLQLDNIAQGLEVYCRVLGLPSILVNIFCLMVFIGFAVQLSAWATGPSKTVTASARRGLYPPRFGFWKTNSHDVSVSILLTQAVVISIFALSFLLIPEVNEAFLLLVSTTTVVYSIVYLIMGAGILKLRKSQPGLTRPFRIGGASKGDAVIWAVTGIMFVTVIVSTGASLLAASRIDAVIELLMAAALLIIPFVIYRFRKASWKTDVQRMLGAPGAEK